MCCCSQKTIKTLGLIITIGFLIAAIVCIILAGVNYKFTDYRFSDFSWKNLGALEVASIVYVIFTSLMGIFSFCCANICVIIIFSILIFISLLFTLAIAIFGLVAGSVETFEKYVGCQTKYTGVLEVWNKVDNYLAFVDTAVCSSDCPCKITNTTGYMSNSSISVYYNQWTKSPNGAINYQNCTQAVQSQVSTKYNSTTGGTNPIDQAAFATLFNNIETSFNCNGFCQTTYTPQGSTTAVTMYKYLFSDLSNGPPQNIGCLKSIADWLPPLLKAFGAIALGVTALQIIAFILAISLCCVRKNEHVKVNS